jgi:hypothetical protein
MPYHRKRHHKKNSEKQKVSPISIFNQVNVKVSPRDSNVQTVRDESREDGVVGCFKSLFSCLGK